MAINRDKPSTKRKNEQNASDLMLVYRQIKRLEINLVLTATNLITVSGPNRVTRHVFQVNSVYQYRPYHQIHLEFGLLLPPKAESDTKAYF